MMNFTPNQSQAINSNKNNILINAGAGSGKTAVLTERIITKIKQGVKLDELLVITFTNAAAKEMKDRINKKLKAEKLEEALRDINNADIMTFDSFLLNLFKTYAYTLNLNDNIRIGTAVELNLLLNKSIDKVLENYYIEESKLLKNNNSSNFLNLIDTYADFSMNDLKENIKLLYQKYVTIINTKQLKGNSLLNIEIFFDEYEKKIFNIIENIKKEVNNFNTLMVGPELQQQKEEYIQKFNEINSCKTYNQLVKNIKELKLEASRKRKGENLEEYKKHIKNINNQYKQLKDFLILKTKEEILKDEEELNDFKEILWEILEKINTQYLKLKKEENIYQFDDIIKLVIEILENKVICQEIKNKYQEILIDEYQDTNDFQNYFINKISNNNLFLVGDIKQSIYGFRNANPDNFQKLQLEFEQNNQNEVINLLDNFRSREEVLDSVNYIFDQIMNEDIANINYQDNHKLNPQNNNFKVKDQNQKYNLEFLIYDKETLKEDKKIVVKEKYIEPYIIVNDIQNKIKNKFQILEDGKLRNCKYQDFTILTKNKTNYKEFQEIFDYYQVPLNSQQEMYLNDEDNIELIVIYNIFQYINGNNDNTLIGILRSFLFDFNDEEIFNYFLNKKEERTKVTPTAKIEETIQNINKICKTLKYETSLNYIFNEILMQFNFIAKMMTLPNVNGIYSKLNQIQEQLIDWDKKQKNIDDVVEYLEQLIFGNNPNDNIEIENNQRNIDAVNLMTIYKSKGLEFPIVYIANNDAKINKSDKERILLSLDYGILMPKINNYIQEKSYLFHLNQINNNKKMIAESVRLLYVALTRASEKVYYITDQKSLDNCEKENLKHGIGNVQNQTKEYQINDLISALIDKEDKIQNINIDIDNIKEVGDYLKTAQVQINESNSQKIINSPKYEYNSINIKREELQTKHASMDQSNLINKEIRASIDLGIKIHNILEQLDFHQIDNQEYQEKFIYQLQKTINNEQINTIIKNIFTQQIFHNNINYWTEYQFIEEKNNQKITGIIDLVLEKENEILIIDYKLNNLEKEEYINQLKVYYDFWKKHTNKAINMYLYSLLENKFKEIEN